MIVWKKMAPGEGNHVYTIRAAGADIQSLEFDKVDALLTFVKLLTGTLRIHKPARRWHWEANSWYQVRLWDYHLISHHRRYHGTRLYRRVTNDPEKPSFADRWGLLTIVCAGGGRKKSRKENRNPMGMEGVC